MSKSTVLERTLRDTGANVARGALEIRKNRHQKARVFFEEGKIYGAEITGQLPPIKDRLKWSLEPSVHSEDAQTIIAAQDDFKVLTELRSRLLISDWQIKKIARENFLQIMKNILDWGEVSTKWRAGQGLDGNNTFIVPRIEPESLFSLLRKNEQEKQDFADWARVETADVEHISVITELSLPLGLTADSEEESIIMQSLGSRLTIKDLYEGSGTMIHSMLLKAVKNLYDENVIRLLLDDYELPYTGISTEYQDLTENPILTGEPVPSVDSNELLFDDLLEDDPEPEPYVAEPEPYASDNNTSPDPHAGVFQSEEYAETDIPLSVDETQESLLGAHAESNDLIDFDDLFEDENIDPLTPPVATFEDTTPEPYADSVSFDDEPEGDDESVIFPSLDAFSMEPSVDTSSTPIVDDPEPIIPAPVETDDYPADTNAYSDIFSDETDDLSVEIEDENSEQVNHSPYSDIFSDETEDVLSETDNALVEVEFEEPSVDNEHSQDLDSFVLSDYGQEVSTEQEVLTDSELSDNEPYDVEFEIEESDDTFASAENTLEVTVSDMPEPVESPEPTGTNQEIADNERELDSLLVNALEGFQPKEDTTEEHSMTNHGNDDDHVFEKLQAFASKAKEAIQRDEDKLIANQQLIDERSAQWQQQIDKLSAIEKEFEALSISAEENRVLIEATNQEQEELRNRVATRKSQLASFS